MLATLEARHGLRVLYCLAPYFSVFEVTMLGTSCAVPTVQRNLSSVAVRRDGDVFLFDCGEGTQRQMMRFGVSYMKVKAIFITHLHLDHFLGAFGMIETMGLNGRKEKLSVFAPKGFSEAFSRKPFVEVAVIGKGFSVDFGAFSVAAFPTKHSRESYGFVLEEKEKRRFNEEKAKSLGLRGPMFSEISKKGKLKVGNKTVKLEDVTYVQPGRKMIYTGDSAPCHETVNAAKGADLLIHEATFSDEKKEEAAETRHSTAAQAAEVAKKAGAKRLLLTHLSGRYVETETLLSEAKAVFKNSEVAEDGMKLQV
jgi:ribonuclease Z